MTRVLAITISSQEGRLAFISEENALGACAGSDTGKLCHLVANWSSATSETRIFSVPSGAPSALGERTVTIAPGLTAQIIDRDIGSGFSYDGPGADLSRMLASTHGLKSPLPRLPATWASRILGAASGNQTTRSAVAVTMPGMKDPVILEDRTPAPAALPAAGTKSSAFPDYRAAPPTKSLAPTPAAPPSASVGEKVDLKKMAAGRRSAVEAKFRAGGLTQAQWNSWSRAFDARTSGE